MPFNNPEENQDKNAAPVTELEPDYPAGVPRIASNMSAGILPVGSPTRILLPGARSAFWQMRPQSAVRGQGFGHQIADMEQEQASPLGGAFSLGKGMRPPQREEIGYRILGLNAERAKRLLVGQAQLLPNQKSSGMPRPEPLLYTESTGAGFNGDPQSQGIFSSFVPVGADVSSPNRMGNGVNRISAEPHELSRFSGRVPSGSFKASTSRFSGPAVSTKSAEAAPQNQTSSESANHVSGGFVDPRSQAADTLKSMAEFLKWRNQNFRSYGGGKWEAPSGRLYTDEDLWAIYPMERQQEAAAQRRREQEKYATGVATGKTVTIAYADGTKERRTGNHPQRDNNPGNMEAGSFTAGRGAVAKDQGFAVFPSAEAGWAAMDANLRSDDYWNLTIDQAIYNWAPPRNARGQIINDTARYQKQVRAALGVAGDTKVSSLTPQQFEELKQAIARVEGFYEKRPGKKVNIVVVPPDRPSVIPRN